MVEAEVLITKKAANEQKQTAAAAEVVEAVALTTKKAADE